MCACVCVRACARVLVCVFCVCLSAYLSVCLSTAQVNVDALATGQDATVYDVAATDVEGDVITYELTSSEFYIGRCEYRQGGQVVSAQTNKQECCTMLVFLDCVVAQQ